MGVMGGARKRAHPSVLLSGFKKFGGMGFFRCGGDCRHFEVNNREFALAGLWIGILADHKLGKSTLSLGGDTLNVLFRVSVYRSAKRGGLS
jgi:hypothetical protein